MTTAYYICLYCKNQVDEPEDGRSWCDVCCEPVEPERVLELDAEDKALEKAAQRGVSKV